MSRSRGGLDRSLEALTIGMFQATGDRDKALLETRSGEYEQQVHIPLSGQAQTAPGFADATVMWEHPFVYAPLQRTIPFPTPHFTYGTELTSGSGELIVIHAQVIAWTISRENWWTGATVRCDVTAPLATAPSPYSALVHCSFQGYAIPTEGDSFQ